MKLGEALSKLESFEDESFILVPTTGKITAGSAALIVPVPEDSEADLGVDGYDYLIEVYHAKDVLENWTTIRNGRVPTPKEAVEAVLFFQENDFYQPL